MPSVEQGHGLVASLLVVLIAGTAFAGKPSTGGSAGGGKHGGGTTLTATETVRLAHLSDVGVRVISASKAANGPRPCSVGGPSPGRS